MKRIFPASLLLLLALALSSCLSNDFSVTVEVKGTQTSSYSFEYYASTSKGGRFVQGAFPLSGGKGEIKGATRNPTVVSMRGMNAAGLLVFYVERGDNIRITGEGGDVSFWSVDGNDINRELSEWRRANRPALTNQPGASVNDAVAKFVESHRNSVASTILMLYYFQRRGNETEYGRLWNMISVEAKTEDVLRTAGRADQLDAVGNQPARLGALELRDEHDSIVRLPAPKSETTLLIFWRASEGAYPAVVDSLKALRKRLGDASRKLRVIDINFDLDSISWNRALRADSTVDWVRSRWYAGEATQLAMDLMVPSTPFYIVADRTGAQIYRGASQAEAFGTAARQAKRK